MILTDHHFDAPWTVTLRKATGRYRVRTTWYGRQVMQIEELVAYSRRPSVHYSNAKTETEWRNMSQSELDGKTFVCLQSS